MKKLHPLSTKHRRTRRTFPRISTVFGFLTAGLPLVALVYLTQSPAAAAPSMLPSENGGAQLVFTPASSSVLVGNSTVVTVSLNSVKDLYGYQFQVNYNSSRVNATGAFLNEFIETTTGAFSPSGWVAACSDGTCSFAISLLNPSSAVTGGGPIAKITFTGLNPGSVPLAFGADILADRNGTPVPHTTLTGTLDVYGSAIVNGIVTLQGRATPIVSGTVTLTDGASKFPPTIASFDPSTGVFSTSVPVDVGGSSYDLSASHSLYLRNQLTDVALKSGNKFTVTTTMLRAGDANNDGTIDIFDLSCIGGGYGTSGTICGSGGSDINADGTVNIFDLVLVGGNYGLTSPQPW